MTLDNQAAEQTSDAAQAAGPEAESEVAPRPVRRGRARAATKSQDEDVVGSNEETKAEADEAVA